MQKPNDLARLNARYVELLNSSIATWLFLDITDGEWSGQIDISTLNDDHQLSFMRFLPKFSTVTAALFASLSSDGVNLQLNEQKIYGRACGMNDVSPMRSVQVTTVISNQRGTKGVMLVKLQEFMQAYRAQCKATFVQFAEECRQQSVAIQGDSSFCSELQDLQHKFSDLELALLNEDDFMQYSSEIKKLIEQHYVDLEILLNQWEKAESESDEQTQIWRLTSAVQFFGVLLGDPSLISFVKYNQGLTYHVINHRQALEYRLLRLQLSLHHTHSTEKAALREGYHTEIEKLLDGRESYVRLLHSVCADPNVDEQGLLEGYKAISQVLCYMDICNREKAPRIKKSLFRTVVSDESAPNDMQLSFREDQITELKAFREVTVVVVLLKYLKDNMRPNKYGFEIESILDSHVKCFMVIADLMNRVVRIQGASCRLDVTPVQQQLNHIIMSFYNHLLKGSEKYCDYIDSKCEQIMSHFVGYVKISKSFLILDKTLFYLENIQLVIGLENQVVQLMQYAEKYSFLKLDQQGLFNDICARVRLVTTLRNELVEQYKSECMSWMNSVEAAFQRTPTSMQELHAAQTVLQYLMDNSDALLHRLQSIVPLEARQLFINFEQRLSKITVQMLKQKLFLLSKDKVLADTLNTLKAKKSELINKIKRIPGLYGVLCRYLAAISGKQDLILWSDVDATCQILIEIENELNRLINEYANFGADFTQEVRFLQTMLLQTQELKNRYNDVRFLISNIESPNFRVVPKLSAEAKNELTVLLGEVHSALIKSNAEFKALSSSIELNCVNDLTLLLESLSLNNISVALMRSWITRFETDYNSCHDLIRRLKEYCNQLSQRIQEDDEPLGDILGPVVLATFSQVGFHLDNNARRNQQILVKLEEKLNSITATDLPSHSM